MEFQFGTNWATFSKFAGGVIGQTPFEAAEVRRAYSTGGKNSTTYVVFHGLGAYSTVTNTRFNGFGELSLATVLTLKI